MGNNQLHDKIQFMRFREKWLGEEKWSRVNVQGLMGVRQRKSPEETAGLAKGRVADDDSPQRKGARFGLRRKSVIVKIVKTRSKKRESRGGGGEPKRSTCEALGASRGWG